MKLAYVAACAADFPSRTANSIHIMRMCDAFDAIGCDVALFVRQRGFTKSEVIDKYGVSSRIDLRFIDSKVPKLNRIFYSRRAALSAKKVGADLIISRSAIPCWFAAGHGIDFVFDAHGPISDRNMVERWCFNRIRSSSHFKRMSFNSRAMKSWYVEHDLLPTSAELIVAMNGASPPSLEQENRSVKWPGRQDKLQVGYTGHLYPGRGVDLILECAKRLPECDFHLIGGNDEDILFWKAKSNTDNIYFHGYVNPSMVSSYRRYCDVLLAPYQAAGVTVSGGKGDSSKYMNPIKVIEYMASGKAIIASDLPAITDCLPQGVAMLVDPNDVDGWVKAIQKLDFDAELLKQLCSRAVAQFGSEYTWEARARKLAGLT